MLSLLVVSGVVGALFVICGGYSVYVLAVVGGLAAFGFLHYLLWGHSFSEAAAEEREEAELRDRLELDEGPADEGDQPPRRF
jgi:hypothetical protein